MVDTGRMPAYVMPELPERDAAAMTQLGVNPLRSAIIRELALNDDGRTSGEIGRAIDVHYRTVWTYLKKLEEDGLVTSTDPGQGRSSHWRVYNLNQQALNSALTQWVSYLHGK